MGIIVLNKIIQKPSCTRHLTKKSCSIQENMHLDVQMK
jgi:hypothetical protein